MLNILAIFKDYIERRQFKKNNTVYSNSLSLFSIGKVVGRGNVIDVRTKKVGGVKLYICGNSNKVTIEEGVVMLSGIIYVEDDNNEIHIGKNSTIYDAELAVAEGCKLTVGEGCLFSKEIRICTTDSHSIVDKMTGERLNKARNINIGKHVWIGYRTAVNKGVTIGDGCVVGGYSVVTHDIPEHTCAVGVPAKVIRSGIEWKHERV